MVSLSSVCHIFSSAAATALIFASALTECIFTKLHKLSAKKFTFLAYWWIQHMLLVCLFVASQEPIGPNWLVYLFFWIAVIKMRCKHDFTGRAIPNCFNSHGNATNRDYLWRKGPNDPSMVKRFDFIHTILIAFALFCSFNYSFKASISYLAIEACIELFRFQEVHWEQPIFSANC